MSRPHNPARNDHASVARASQPRPNTPRFSPVARVAIAKASMSGDRRLTAARVWLGVCWMTGVFWMTGGSVLVVSLGCNGRGHRDVYQQKMAQEIRVLEDQLYEADYENRILMDKLHRAGLDRKTQSSSKALRSGSAGGPSTPSPSRPLDRTPPVPVPGPLESFDMGHGFNDGPIGDPPADDPFRSRTGEPESVPPGRPLRDPDASPSVRPDSSRLDDIRNGEGVRGDNGLPDLGSMIDEGEPVRPGELIPVPTPDAPPGENRRPNSSNPFTLPPPRTADPPGPSDMRIDPIEPGEILPPNSTNGSPDGPRGKIELPPGLGMLGGLGAVAGAGPQIVLATHQIEIDPTATQPRFVASEDDPTAGPMCDGIDVVIRGTDQYGNAIGLRSRTLDPIDKLATAQRPAMRPLADDARPPRVSLVALDPERSGDEAKLGRWDFDATLLDKLQRQTADENIVRLPIRWQEKRPSGDRVIVFARFENDQRDLRCDAEIRLDAQPSVAGWLPRR